MWLHLLWTDHWKNCDYDAMLLSYKDAKQMAKNNNWRHGPKQLPNKYPYLYPKTMPSAMRSDSIISWLSIATITLNDYHIELFRNHLLFLPFYAFLVSQKFSKPHFPIQQNNKNYTHWPTAQTWVLQTYFCRRTGSANVAYASATYTNIWHRHFFGGSYKRLAHSTGKSHT